MDADQRAAFGVALGGLELAAATTPDTVTDSDTGRVNAGRCWGQVHTDALDNDEELRAAVNTAVPIWDSAPSHAGFDDAALDDRHVGDALATWSCVEARAGQQAGTPSELARRFLHGHYDGSATAEEVDVAAADAKCQQESDLWAAWHNVVAELTRQQLGADAGRNDAWTHAQSRWSTMREAHWPSGTPNCHLSTDRSGAQSGHVRPL